MTAVYIEIIDALLMNMEFISHVRQNLRQIFFKSYLEIPVSRVK
jgi:hypothetical protein